MDLNGIPKKVVRHVEKAIETLKSLKKPLKFSEVLAEVKYTMRNLVPVKDLDDTVKLCMRNLKKKYPGISPNDSENKIVTIKSEPSSSLTLVDDVPRNYGLRSGASNPMCQSHHYQNLAGSQFDCRRQLLHPERYMSRVPFHRSIQKLVSSRTIQNLARTSSKHYRAYRPSSQTLRPKTKIPNSATHSLKKFHVDSKGELYPCTGLCKKALQNSNVLSNIRAQRKLRNGICKYCTNPMRRSTLRRRSF